MALQRSLFRVTRGKPTLLASTVSAQRCIVRHSSTDTRPLSVVDASFWRSLVPKFLRRENRDELKKRAKEWNPATFFIVMFLLIGSMSIQMIALRNSFERYMRQSEARIAVLRGVVEKIQRGEQVDVEKALGTGDAKRESEWEEMLQAIERDDAARKVPKREKPNQPKPETKFEASTTETLEHEGPAPPKSRTANLGGFF